MKNTLIYIISIFSLFIIGFIFWKNFIEFTISQLESKDIQIVSSSMNDQFYSHLLFSIFIGSIPALFLLVRKSVGLNEIKQYLITLGLIIIGGIILWQFRIIQANNQLQELSAINANSDTKNLAYFDSLTFEIFLFIGFILGTVLSILLYKIFLTRKK